MRSCDTGGGAGGREKSKQSDTSSAARSRALNGARPNVVAQNLSRLTCECRTLEMWPTLAYGLSTRQASRVPYRNCAAFQAGCDPSSFQVTTLLGSICS